MTNKTNETHGIGDNYSLWILPTFPDDYKTSDQKASSMLLAFRECLDVMLHVIVIVFAITSQMQTSTGIAVGPSSETVGTTNSSSPTPIRKHFKPEIRWPPIWISRSENKEQLAPLSSSQLQKPIPKHPVIESQPEAIRNNVYFAYFFIIVELILCIELLYYILFTTDPQQFRKAASEYREAMEVSERTWKMRLSERDKSIV